MLEKCPECGSSYLVEKTLKKGPVLACPEKKCTYQREEPRTEEATVGPR